MCQLHIDDDMIQRERRKLMHYTLRRGIAALLIITILISIFPHVLAAEREDQIMQPMSETTTVVPVPNDDLKHSDEKVFGYWINPSNFTISNASIDNLTNRGVTDLYVLVKGEAGSINTTALKNVISYASSNVRVHAWLMCARDNSYLKSNPTHAVYHFRVGYKNNAHSSSSSYYDSRNGFVDLRNTSYQKYFNSIVDDMEAIEGLDGIHLDTIRYGGDYYDWHTNLKKALGKSAYNTMAKAMCGQHGYTYAADSDGYYAFTGTTTADDSSLSTLVNANGEAAQKYIAYRTETVTNFVKSVRENLGSDMILTAACMPEPAISLYGKATYGQDFASMAPYVDYVQIMSYFGDYYFLNNNTYDTSWPANLCKNIAKDGCNVVAGIQGYAFVNTDTEGRNGLNPTGYETQKQAEAINDARRLINGDPTYGGDILGSAVFRTGTCAHVKISYNKSAQTVTFSFVAGETAVKSIRIRLYNGYYIDKSRCTVSGTSYTYNGVTYIVGGTATNDYYYQADLSTTISAYGTKTLTLPVCTNTGEAKAVDYNYNHFAAFSIFSSTSKSSSTYLPISQESFVNSGHTSCTFTKTTPQIATCTAPGYHLYTCETCKYDYAEYIPQLSHEYVATVTAPTCSSQGYTTYTCKNGCNDSYTQDYVDALSHDYISTVIEPTCTHQGYTLYTCANGCGDSYEEAYVDALGHNYGEAVVTTVPSCTQQGISTSTCSNCNDTIEEVLPPLGHGETMEMIISATCTENGVKNIVCTVCEETLESETIEAFGHVYETTVTAPSCTENGVTTYICVNCDDTYSEEIEALGHEYELTEIVEPTCTTDGAKTFTCACGDTYIEPIPATGHGEFTQNMVDASCAEEGAINTVCGICGEIVSSETINALGHSYQAVVTEPTCIEGGFTVNTCSVCDDSYISDEIPALGHAYESAVTEPTCTEGGFTVNTCSVCDDSYISDEIPALGHAYESAVTEPTCIEGGFTVNTCSVCDDSYISDETSALGHSYCYTDQGEMHLVTCKNCDFNELQAHEVETMYCIQCKALLCAHENQISIVDVAPTCTTGGSERIVCADCDELLQINELAANGHNLTYHETTRPTCTTEGNRNYWHCEVCKSYFADESCSYDLPESYVVKPALGHNYLYTDNGNDGHTVNCDRCNYTEIEAHSFVDDVCICSAVKVKESVLDSSLTFDMDIAVGSSMSVNYTFMASCVSSFTDFYLVVKKDVADGDAITTTYGITEDREALNVKLHPVTGEAVMYQVTFSGINAKEMGDCFDTVLYAVKADGTLHYSSTQSASIKDYLIGKIDSDASSEELKTMAVDMLHYGAAAQIRLNYDTQNLVTADLTAEQLAYATTDVPEATNYVSYEGEGSRLSAVITVGAKVQLNVSCIYTPTDAAELKCVIKDALSGDVLQELPVNVKSNVMCTAAFDDVGAKEMRRVITATIYEGETAVSQTITWSVESYVAQVREKANATEAELQMVNAMLIYGDAVARYLSAT